MDTIKELQAKVDTFAKYCKQAKEAKDFATVDDAKVQGIIAYKELVRQVNRVRIVLIEAAADRRAELTNQVYAEVHETVKAASAPVEAPAPKKAPAKKTTKAKKTK